MQNQPQNFLGSGGGVDLISDTTTEDREVIARPSPVETARAYGVTIEIGGMPIRLCTDDSTYLRKLQKRFARFLGPSRTSQLELDIDLVLPGRAGPEEQVQVRNDGGRWTIERSDFQAGLDPASRRGWVRQSAHPYATDSVLRILHSMFLAREGGFLLHSASAMRNGRSFFFFGPSGAGKSTILSLAPPDVTLLTDEISYLRKQGHRYVAHGTPFTGELGRAGKNISAPVAAFYRLEQGTENRIEPMPPAEAVRELLGCVLFFANDSELMKQVFHAACELVSCVPVQRLVFQPNARVWDLIV
jgi:hypothetical protein